MRFDPTISLGNVIEFLAFLVTIAVIYAKLVARLIRLETKVQLIWRRCPMIGGGGPSSQGPGEGM